MGGGVSTPRNVLNELAMKLSACVAVPYHPYEKDGQWYFEGVRGEGYGPFASEAACLSAVERVKSWPTGRVN